MRARSVLTAGTVVIAVSALVLAVMGRTLWCSCGSPVPWAWNVWTKHNSQHLIDPYTFTHVLHGLVFYAALSLVARRSTAGTRGVVAVAVEGAWEILENSPMVIERYRTVTMSLDYYGDSVVNSAADIAACGLGFWIASRLPWRVSLAIFVVTELVLIAWVRDSLVLNVIMLVHPIEAIRAWQAPT